MSEYEIEKFEESIRDKIYSVRGYQVMLDRDLAELYGVETKVLNQAVKRNAERFPYEFCFQLKYSEVPELRSQFVTSTNVEISAQSQMISSKKGGRRYIPNVFTQEGVAMLSAVLKSDTAVKISIKIIKAFVEMRKFIQTNGLLFQRVDNLEVKLIETNLKLIDNDQKFEKVFEALESKDRIPSQGLFYDGQIFDAYNFVSDLFRKAVKSILIIDNYVDDSVLFHLTAASKGVKVKILTKSISDKLALDIQKFSQQYFHIEAKVFTLAHDRFIIIDDKDVYHFGASLKDLGKKWFGFSKLEKSDMELLIKLEKY
jgi:phage regulator Rha-like protein